MNKPTKGVPKARTNNIVVSELKDELLLYCLETHKAFCLNHSAAAVYQAADGFKTTAEIAENLSKELKAKVTEEFVSFSLGELKAKNLIEFSAVSETQTGLTSRREAIRKIGLSTAVALPLITMLVAPKAADAQSVVVCGNILDPCSGPGQGTCCAGLTCCPGVNQCFLRCPA